MYVTILASALTGYEILDSLLNLSKPQSLHL